MDEEQFERFYNALVEAEVVPLKEFEKEIYFEGCMPVEVLAQRGEKTLLFGALKPVGLEDPVTGKRYKAVVQLRQDDAAGTLYNIVGFQTHMKWGAQKRSHQSYPSFGKCRNRPLRCHAPKYIHQFAACIGFDVPIEG